jgi:calcineurin-like phosphoesterase family protein
MVQVGFQEAHDRLHTVIDGVEVYLCHRPEFKLDAFYPKALNICGHVHDSWTLNKGIHNVSVEVRNYRPVTIAQIQLDTEDEV